MKLSILLVLLLPLILIAQPSGEELSGNIEELSEYIHERSFVVFDSVLINTKWNMSDYENTELCLKALDMVLDTISYVLVQTVEELQKFSKIQDKQVQIRNVPTMITFLEKKKEEMTSLAIVARCCDISTVDGRLRKQAILISSACVIYAGAINAVLINFK